MNLKLSLHNPENKSIMYIPPLLSPPSSPPPLPSPLHSPPAPPHESLRGTCVYERADIKSRRRINQEGGGGGPHVRAVHSFRVSLWFWDLLPYYATIINRICVIFTSITDTHTHNMKPLSTWVTTIREILHRTFLPTQRKAPW